DRVRVPVVAEPADEPAVVRLVQRLDARLLAESVRHPRTRIRAPAEYRDRAARHAGGDRPGHADGVRDGPPPVPWSRHRQRADLPADGHTGSTQGLVAAGAV